MTKIMKLASASIWITIAIVLAVSAAAIAVAVRFFDLTVTGAVALHFVVWWTVLFAVLPFGVRSQAEANEVAEGTEPGAPTVPALREKAIWTTLWASIVLMLVSGLLPLTGL